MRPALGLAALLGLSLALIVQLVALAGIDVLTRFPAIWLLHIGIFFVQIPFIHDSRKWFAGKPSFAQIRAAFPAWVLVLGCVLCAYAIMNFVLYTFASQGGSASLVAGKFVLMNHGDLIRELSAQEYASLRANQARVFSGHWLVFYFIPFAYFLYRK